MEKVNKLKPIDEFSEKYFFDGDLFKEGVLLPVPEGVNLDEEMEHASARQLATHAKSGTLVYAVGHSLVILNKKGLVKLVDQVRDKNKQSTRPALSSFQKEGLGICINFQSGPQSEPIKERIRNFRLSDGSSSQVYIAVEFDKEIIVSDYLQMLKGSSSEQIYSIASPSGFIRYFQEGGDIIALTTEGKFVCNSKPSQKIIEDAVTHLNAQTKGAFRFDYSQTSTNRRQVTTVERNGEGLIIKVHVWETNTFKWRIDGSVSVEMDATELINGDVFTPKGSQTILVPTMVKNEACFEISVLAVVKTGSTYQLMSTGDDSYAEFDNNTYDSVPEGLEFGFTQIAEHGLCVIACTHASKTIVFKIDDKGNLFRPHADAIDAPVLCSKLDSYDEAKLKGVCTLMFDLSFPDLDPAKLMSTHKSLTELAAKDDEGAPLSIPIPPSLVTLNEAYIASFRPLSDIRPQNLKGKGKCILVTPEDTKLASNLHTVKPALSPEPPKPAVPIQDPPKPADPTQSSTIVKIPAPEPQTTKSVLSNPDPDPANKTLNPGPTLQKKSSGTTLPGLTAVPFAAAKDLTGLGLSNTGPKLDSSLKISSTPSGPTDPKAPNAKGTEAPNKDAAAKDVKEEVRPATIPLLVELMRNEVKDQKDKPIWANLEKTLLMCQQTFKSTSVSLSQPAQAGAPQKTPSGLPLATQTPNLRRPQSPVPKLAATIIPTNNTVEALLKGLQEAKQQVKVPFSKHRTLKRVFGLLEERDRRLQVIKTPVCLAQIESENEALFTRLEQTEAGIEHAQRALRTFASVFKEEVARVSHLVVAGGQLNQSHQRMDAGKPANKTNPFPILSSTKPVFNSFFGPNPQRSSFTPSLVQKVGFSNIATSKPSVPGPMTSSLRTGQTGTPSSLHQGAQSYRPLSLAMSPSKPAPLFSGLESFLREYTLEKSEQYDQLLRELHNLQRLHDKQLQARGAMKRLNQFHNTVRPSSLAYSGGESSLPKSRGTVFDLRNIDTDDVEDEPEDEDLREHGFLSQNRTKSNGWRVPSAFHLLNDVQQGLRHSSTDRAPTEITLGECLQRLQALKTAEIRLQYCLNLSLRKELEARTQSARAAEVVQNLATTSNPATAAPANPAAPPASASNVPVPSNMFSSDPSKPKEGPKPEPVANFSASASAQTPVLGMESSKKGANPSDTSTKKEGIKPAGLGGIFGSAPPQLGGALKSNTSNLFPTAELVQSINLDADKDSQPPASDPLNMFKASKPPGGAEAPKFLDTKLTEKAEAADKNPAMSLSFGVDKLATKAPSTQTGFNLSNTALQGSASLSQSTPAFGKQTDSTPGQNANQDKGSGGGALNIFPQASATPGQGMFSRTGISNNKEPAPASNDMSSPPRKSGGDTFLSGMGEGADTQSRRKQSTLPSNLDPRLPKNRLEMSEVAEVDEEGSPSLTKTISKIDSSDPAGNPSKKLSGQSKAPSKEADKAQTPNAGFFSSQSGVLGQGVNSNLFESAVGGMTGPGGAAPSNSGGLGLFGPKKTDSSGPFGNPTPKPTGTNPAGPTATASTGGGMFGSMGINPTQTGTAVNTPAPTPGGLFNNLGTGGPSKPLFASTPAPIGGAGGLNFTSGSTQNIFAQGDKSMTSAASLGQTANFGALKKEPVAFGTTSFGGGGMGSSSFGGGAALTGFQVPSALGQATGTGTSIFGGNATGTNWLTPGTSNNLNSSAPPVLQGNMGSLRG